jgi:hypothetical protein
MRWQGPVVEQRWGERHRINIGVTLKVGPHNALPVLLKSVSLSGALVDMRLDLPPLTPVELTLPALGGAVSAPLEARVVREGTKGCALEWLSFGPNPIRMMLHRAQSQAA